jgi:hypothetical protein
MRVRSDQLAMPQTQLSGTVDLESHRLSMLPGLRQEIRSRWPEWITIALYAAVVASAIPYHEPWVDEAQPWQMARTLPLVALFHRYIRYEAPPDFGNFCSGFLIGHTSATRGCIGSPVQLPLPECLSLS